MATATFTASRDIAETRTTTLVLKKDGSDATPTAMAKSKNETRVVVDGKDTRKIVTRVVVDGKEMSMEEFETTTEPEKIESMNIDKTDPKHPVVRVTTKKK
jgi:glycine cleavage system regulatory protein